MEPNEFCSRCNSVASGHITPKSDQHFGDFSIKGSRETVASTLPACSGKSMAGGLSDDRVTAGSFDNSYNLSLDTNIPGSPSFSR